MSVKVYKDNLRQSILRTLVFSDIVIFFIIGALIAIIILFIFNTLLRPINWTYYLFVLGMIEPTFVIIVTFKIDNQTIYKILARLATYTINPRKKRFKQMGGYYNGFYIQDGLIVRKKSICKIFRIIPYDISAINAIDRSVFFENVKKTLNTLPSRMQIIVKKEITTRNEFTDHLLHIYTTVSKNNPVKERMIRSYQNELISYIEQEKLLTVKQYGIFSLSVDTTASEQKVRAIGKLEDMYKRISNSLEACHVGLRQMTNKDLEEFMKGILR